MEQRGLWHCFNAMKANPPWVITSKKPPGKLATQWQIKKKSACSNTRKQTATKTPCSSEWPSTILCWFRQLESDGVLQFGSTSIMHLKVKKQVQTVNWSRWPGCLPPRQRRSLGTSAKSCNHTHTSAPPPPPPSQKKEIKRIFQSSETYKRTWNISSMLLRSVMCVIRYFLTLDSQLDPSHFFRLQWKKQNRKLLSRILSRSIGSDHVVGEALRWMEVEDENKAGTVKHYDLVILVFAADVRLRRVEPWVSLLQVVHGRVKCVQETVTEKIVFDEIPLPTSVVIALKQHTQDHQQQKSRKTHV